MTCNVNNKNINFNNNVYQSILACIKVIKRAQHCPLQKYQCAIQYTVLQNALKNISAFQHFLKFALQKFKNTKFTPHQNPRLHRESATPSYIIKMSYNFILTFYFVVFVLLPLYIQVYTYRFIHTGLYIQVYSYRFIHTGLYIQVCTYRFIHTGLYIQIYTYRFIHTGFLRVFSLKNDFHFHRESFLC